MIDDSCYELRLIIEQHLLCRRYGHSPSGCFRCRALAALDRIEQELKRLEAAL